MAPWQAVFVCYLILPGSSPVAVNQTRFLEVRLAALDSRLGLARDGDVEAFMRRQGLLAFM